MSMIDNMDLNSKEFQAQFGQLPTGMDVYQVLSMMSEEQKSSITKQIDPQMETMGTSTMMIAAGNGVKAEYQALGADIEKVRK